jgi:excinuclease ABC subunit B
MQKTIEETERRRDKQMRYNMEHNITPRQIEKARTMTDLLEIQREIGDKRAYVEVETPSQKVADPIIEAMSPQQLKKSIESTRKRMQEAAKKLDFILAAQLRDEMLYMMDKLENEE